MGLNSNVAAGHLPAGVCAEVVPSWWLQGKVCYYCASQGQLLPSATLHHRYIDCERRSLAGATEYTEGSIERAVEILTRRKEEVDGESSGHLDSCSDRKARRSENLTECDLESSCLAAELERLQVTKQRVRDAMKRMVVLEGQIQFINHLQQFKYATRKNPPPPSEAKLWYGPLNWTQTQTAAVSR